MSNLKNYEAVVSRSGNWWHVAVPDAGPFAMTQARRLDDVEPMTRDMLSALLEVAEDSFTVKIVLKDQDLESLSSLVGVARANAVQAEKTAMETTRQSAKKLHAKGLPVRDIAKLLDISKSRVSELTRAS